MGIDLDALKKIAVDNLGGPLGHLTGGSDPLNRETALDELNSFFERNGETVSSASFDFALELIDFTVTDDESVEAALARISEATADEIADLAEDMAGEAEATAHAILEGRRKVLEDVKNVLGKLARAALAAALAGLAGAV